MAQEHLKVDISCLELVILAPEGALGIKVFQLWAVPISSQLILISYRSF